MKLLFVYNANSGFLDKLLDNAHKIVSPTTYDCNLCAITFGNFKENELWKTFRENSAISMEFYYKDKFLREFRSKWLPAYDFPVILWANGKDLELFITADELNKMTSPEALIEAVERRLEAWS